MNKFDKYRTGKNVILQLLKAKILKKRIPVRVFLQLTKYCNMRCRHCWVYQKEYQDEILKTKELSTKEMIDLIDLLYKKGTRWINFLGGEPLLRKDLGTIIDHAKKLGIYCETSTNGLLVDYKINELKKFHNVCISIDGNKVSNDAIRGKGNFDKAIHAIETVLKNNIPLRLHSVLSGYTVDALDDMVKLCQKYKLKFNFAECSLPDIKSKDRKLILSDKQILRFYEKYKQYRKTTDTVASSMTAINAMMNWPLKKRTMNKNDAKKIKSGSYIPCQLGITSCMVDVDGKVYACPERWKDGITLFDGGFDKAWEYLKNKDCAACRILGSTEQSLTLGLNLRSLINAIIKFA